MPAAPTEADVLGSLDRVSAALVEAKASPLIRSRVDRIDRLVRATLPRLAALGLGSADAYAVVATATSYLPEAVAGYLRLPRDWADTRPIDAGRTALMMLVDQLELLGSTMVKVLDAANRSDAQALIAHGRFLEAKFGAPTGGGALEAPSGTPVPGPSSDGSPPSRSTNSLDLE
ncbi:hypothetical protein V6K52_00405 [Knoellia sp. S7-12]|uniref:hypothetical protein n=1 Tax=Knoellia sp. S7-12 TaxID=3126698 RepID=UPI00336917B9